MSINPPYVVIGSNCFTGSHIIDALLEEGRRVYGVSRSPEYDPIFLPYRSRDCSNFSFYQIDLVRNPKALIELIDEVRPAVVINVAALSEVALSNERPVEYFETNTTGVVRLADHLRTASYLERYVHISSAEIYGSCDQAVDETHLFDPSTPYAVSKAAADMYLATLVRNFGFPCTSIRSTNVYGAHQQLFKIIPRTVIYLKQGRKVQLHGGGRSVKAFVHIRDVVDGTLRAIKAQKPAAVYHFSTDDSRTVADVVAAVCKTMGRDPSDVTERVGERLGQDSRYWLDSSRAAGELGWRPRIGLEEGVAEVVDWVERSWDRIVEHPLDYVHQ